MANEEHLDILRQGVDVWNKWRYANPQTKPDLSGADLTSAKLSRINLKEADLHQANLNKANLSRAKLNGARLAEAKLVEANLRETKLVGVDFIKANLSGIDLMGANLSQAKLIAVNLSNANLIGANLIEANLNKANLSGAKLSGAHLSEANLSEADFKEAKLRDAFLIRANMTGANLSGANLNQAHLVSTDLTETNLTGCSIYGMSAWDLNVDKNTKQSGLIITPPGAPTITVDNLEVAQFIYLLLTNKKVRNIINTVANKAVLIMGRFTSERKSALNVIKEELRKRNYVAITFDFDKQESRDLTETVSTLANMVRFILADITAPESIAQELQRIILDLPSVPVQPLLQGSSKEYELFEPLARNPWILKPHCYADLDDLLSFKFEKVITSVEAKAKKIEETRTSHET